MNQTRSRVIAVGLVLCGLSGANASQTQLRPFEKGPSQSLGQFKGKWKTRGFKYHRWERRGGGGYRGSRQGSSLERRINTGSEGRYADWRGTAPTFAPAELKGRAGGASGQSGATSGLSRSSLAAGAPRVAGGPITGVVLLPRRTVETDEAEDILSPESPGRPAFVPVMGNGLQRPNLGLMSTSPPGRGATGSASEGSEAGPGVFGGRTLIQDQYVPGRGAPTYRCGFYAARQLAQARGYLREKKYEQALVCYRGATNLDRSCREGVIGAIYCQMLAGRYQSAGAGVLRLARVWQDFWKGKVDYSATFGVGAEVIKRQLSDAETEIDDFIIIHEGSAPGRGSHSVALAYLSKLFIAWVMDRQDLVRKNIELAAKSSPFHPAIQGLYRRITGKEKREIEVQPLGPVGMKGESR